MNIEFTSRYGAAGPPSWLRGCFAKCEAMGWYPTQDRPEGRALEADGWYFVKCENCGGTGRCSWLTTITRVPGWFVRGVRWCWTMGPSSTAWRGHPASWTRRAWLTVKIAFLCDLGVRM